MITRLYPLQFLLLVLMTLSTSLSFANRSETSCICQIDTEPRYQVPFFRAGCALWLASNGCLRGRIQSIDDPIKLNSNVQKLKVGYVGHWSSSASLVEYLEQQIEPILSPSLKSVYIDNTACHAMEKPELILNWLQRVQKKYTGRINIIGNQTISIGMWQPFYWGQANFTAQAQNDPIRKAFPRCEEIVHRRCLRAFQEGESGYCSLGDKHYKLTCAPTSFIRAYSDEMGEMKTWTETLYVWSSDFFTPPQSH